MDRKLFQWIVVGLSAVAAILLVSVATLIVRHSTQPEILPEYVPRVPIVVLVHPTPATPPRPGPPLPGRATAFVASNRPTPAPGHWPQWRGPDRDNVSKETGLLGEWPAGGPPLLWKAEGLGEGKGGLSVAGGLIFLLGYRDGLEFLTALDGAGRVAWSAPIGAAVNETYHMRWLSQRTPTVDNDRVYALTARGVLLCLSSSNGDLLWQRDYALDFGGKPGEWGGYCDFPFADGNRVICTPSGPKSTVVALDRRTGSTVWSCDVPGVSIANQSALISCILAGVRQYVRQLPGAIVGIAPENGRILWSHPMPGGRGRGVQVPIPLGDNHLLSMDGWGRRVERIEIGRTGDQFKATSQYEADVTLNSWFANEIRIGDRLYAFEFSGRRIPCIDLHTGSVTLQKLTKTTFSTCTCSDGAFYLRGEMGELALAKPGGSEVKILSAIECPRGKETTSTFPVVAGGRLYLRDQDRLFCYDVRSPAYQEPAPIWDIASRVGPGAGGSTRPNLAPPKGEPDAIFVPTPMDVVEKMLELAAVRKEDRVVDLGSGDGRILIAASGKHGCPSVGYEIDPALVRESRTRIKERALSHLAVVEDSDLFQADLSRFSVVTLYLGERNNARLIPQLQKLKPGARIVSHAHGLGVPGLEPDRSEEVRSQEDGANHSIYLWTAPLKLR